MSKFKDIEEWAKSEAPKTYDLVEDTANLDYGKIESLYEKFLIYKYDKKVNWDIIGTRKGKFQNIDEYITRDPDTHSCLLQEIYKILWPELTEKEFMTSKKWICSDNMTSQLTSFKYAMGLIIETEEQTSSVIKVIKRIKDIKNKTGYRPCAKLYILAAAEQGEEFEELVEKYYFDNMKMFLAKGHTIGNYCPVPVGFNRSRFGGGTYDFWDLTLMKIHEWYCTENKDKKEDIIKELLRDVNDCTEKKKYREYCQEWLKWIGEEKEGEEGWHKFIDNLYMRAFVNSQYEVNRFWDGHDWENLDLPKNKETINQALRNMTESIDKRSEDIVIAILSKIGESQHGQEN